MSEKGNNVKNIILQILVFNEYISEDKEKELLLINKNSDLLKKLESILGKKLNLIKDFCLEQKLFTKEEYKIFLDFDEKSKKVDLKVEEKKEKQPIKKIVEEVSIKESKKNIDKSDDLSTKSLSEEDIKKLMSKKGNLYELVPGDKIPKKDNIFYAKVQLYRFIDSGSSDFIIETQKRDGQIQYQIIFKIDGENEIQDSSNWTRPEDTSSSNDTIFFESVRRWIGSNKGRINADLKHVMQDGSFSLEYKQGVRDFRLNSIPTRCYGIAYPRYVQRLATEGDSCTFDNIQMLPHAQKMYEEMVNNRIAGTILITGPTGSGKTTTIYAILNKIDKEKFSVLSVEKPIESQLYGVNQTEVDSVERDDKKERYTNLEALRGILRQALDVVFIGEMRDSEEIIEGINTGLIGNKLITTLHTNNGVDTILRLITEGVNTNAIGNGVKYITAQRLVNRLCPHCCIEDPKKDEYIKKIEKSFKRGQVFFQREFRRILRNIPEDEFTLDDLELIIQDKLDFAYLDDKEEILKKIEKNIKKIGSSETKEEKIKIILDLAEGYPYPEFRKQEFLKRLKNEKLKTADKKGCPKCRNGYKGRIMIVEILKMDKAIKNFIHKDIKLSELENFLLNRGYITMEIYGYMLALDGIISMNKLKEFVED